MLPTFAGPRLKIERAKHHITDLNFKLDAFARDVHTITVNYDPQRGYDVLEIVPIKKFPDEFGLIVGDALHNLSAALDFTINDVVYARLGKWDDFTKFPFFETKRKLECAINPAPISQASKAAVDFIMDTVKPYRGGNDALWALHDLDIIDKHRLLLPVIDIKAIKGIRVEGERGQPVPFPVEWYISKRRAVIHEFIGYRNVRITNYGQTSFSMLFNMPLPMQGRHVVPTLIQFTEIVTEIVNGIEIAFRSEK